MKLTNVKLIFAREVRDQLRDRRTLLMIVVLPLFLYPLLGMSLFQIAQFVHEQLTQVLVVGADNRRASRRCSRTGDLPGGCSRTPGGRGCWICVLRPEPVGRRVQGPAGLRPGPGAIGQVRCVAVLPPDFARRLAAFHRAVRRRGGVKSGERWGRGLDVPSPEVAYNAANDKSRLTFDGINEALEKWKQLVRDESLEQNGVSARVASPFSVVAVNVADPARRRGAMWSKMLPVLLVLWALTGAFYPAIDLCAGEKERGTLETLLSSPAGAAKSWRGNC